MSYIDLSGWGRALGSGLARATILTAFFIGPIVLIILSKPDRGLDVLGMFRKLASRLVRP